MGRRGWKDRSNSSKSRTAWQPDVSERNSTTLRKSTPPTLAPDGLPNGERTRAGLSLRKPKPAVAAVWVELGVSTLRQPVCFRHSPAAAAAGPCPAAYLDGCCRPG